MNSCRTVVAGLALLVAMLVAPTPSLAQTDATWWESRTPQERRETVNYLYSAAGHPMPYAADAAGAQVLADRVRTLGQDETLRGTRGVATGELRAAVGAGLIPRPRDMMRRLFRPPVGFFVVAAAAYFTNSVGKQIFVEWGAGRQVDADSTFEMTDMSWRPDGEEIFYGVRSPGAYVYRGTYKNESYFPVFWFSSPCRFSGFTAPSGARLGVGVSTASCAEPLDYPPYQRIHENVTIHFPYLEEGDLEAAKTMRPRGFETVHPDNRNLIPFAPPEPSVAEPAIEAALEAADGAGLRAQLEWEATDGNDEMIEPIRVGPVWQAPPGTDWRRWCEKTPPGMTDVTLDPHKSRWELQSEFSANVIGRAPMLWGTDGFAEASAPTWNYIKGFGLRKIVAKHGWMPIDRLETAEALRDSNPNPPQNAWTQSVGRWTFEGPEYRGLDPADVTKIVRCRRVVVVDTKADVAHNETEPRGIVTSYGGIIGQP